MNKPEPYLIDTQPSKINLAAELAYGAKLDGYGGDGVTASLELRNKFIVRGSGWYSDEAYKDLQANLERLAND